MTRKLISLITLCYISQALGSEIELVRKHAKSACYVYGNSVYFTYLNEEVGGRDHLDFNEEITSVDDIKAAISAAKNEGAIIIPNGRFEASRFLGDMALENDSVILLNSKKLERFMSLNCAGE